jgi:RHS repeat-associated protein
MVSQNLINNSQAINYVYDYNRLTQISYPDPIDNVYYEYGEQFYRESDFGTVIDNNAGRLIGTQDATSVQSFEYGNMGEVIKNSRSFWMPGNDQVTYTFNMEWTYDRWGRVMEIIYPDEDQVRYTYNNGGLLQSMSSNKNGITYPIIDQIKYNMYGKRTYIEYGNGSKTHYTYNDFNQNLVSLISYNSSSKTMQELNYTYDDVNNITKVINSSTGANSLGGEYTYNYSYDDIYRLTGATGTFGTTYNYDLDMSYSKSGNIISKDLSANKLINGSLQSITYSNTYTYNTNQPHTIASVEDYDFVWDANGNMTMRSNNNTQQFRKLCWDEENRLSAVADIYRETPQTLSNYLYDAGGERTWKMSGNVSVISQNGQNAINSVAYNDVTLYSSAYMVANMNEVTKHYYIEGERVSSRLEGGFAGMINSQIDDVPLSRINGENENISILELYNLTQSSGCVLNDIVATIPTSLYAMDDLLGTDNLEDNQYFYHSDHLGSSAWVTDASGNAIQHLQYLPFGEDFVSQQSTSFASRYTFSAKEKDTETGYSYFGARYYDSDLSVWLSVDPMADKYPSMSAYMYVMGNPIVLKDPDGRFPISIHAELVNTAISNKSYYFTPLRGQLLRGAGVVADIKHMDDSRVHMDNMSGYTSISKAYNTAVGGFKTNTSKGDWTQAGVSLHTVADFYAHSNYIELYKEYAKANNLSMEVDAIPTFSEAQKDKKLMGYLKENGLKTGTYGSGIFAYIKDKFSKDPNSHGQMNKDTNDSPAGAQTYNSSATMHEAAKAVAQKEINAIVNEENP